MEGVVHQRGQLAQTSLHLLERGRRQLGLCAVGEVCRGACLLEGSHLRLEAQRHLGLSPQRQLLLVLEPTHQLAVALVLLVGAQAPELATPFTDVAFEADGGPDGADGLLADGLQRAAPDGSSPAQLRQSLAARSHTFCI